MMEIYEKSTQLEEVSIDKVCRTCLNTSEELMVTLFDEDEEEKTNFQQMILICFGKIVNIAWKIKFYCFNSISFRFHHSKIYRQNCVMNVKS